MSGACNGALFVSNFLSGAGLNRGYSEELTDRLEARGWQITRTSSYRGRTSRMIDMLRTAWVNRRRYDVAHVDVFSGPSFLWAESVCFELRRLGKPFILTLRGGNLPDFARRWPRRVRRLFAAAELVTVPSTYLGERMREYRADLALCRNAIDSHAYGFRERRTLEPHLVWVRAFHAVYNPVLAVQVLHRLHARFPKARLSMLGPDKDGSLALVDQAARDLGVRDRVELVGPVPKSEIARHLATADLFINTTDADNTPISVLEGMAAGLCVVSTSVGGIPYLLEHERNALLVPPRDAAAMTSALERLLDDPDLAHRLSCGAHDLAVAHDWAPVLQQWETTLREVSVADVKRLLDLAIAGGTAFVASAPVIAALALAVKLDSPGPAFFVQTRVGRGRRLIKVPKLRTMVADAERTGPQITAGRDPRITRVGALLRKTKLDELPQLWSVLRGDMSIVGPRPEVPRYVERYRPEWQRLLDVRPGLTDLASLTFRDEEALLADTRDRERAYAEVVMPMKLQLALDGLDRSSVTDDLRVIVRTAASVVGASRTEDDPIIREARRRIAALEGHA